MGGVVIAAGATVVGVRAGAGDGLVVDLGLPTGTVRDVLVRCEELGSEAHATWYSGGVVDIGRGVLCQPAAPSLELYASFPEPGARSVHIDWTDALFNLEARGEYSHVAWAWANGSKLDGWVATSALRWLTFCETKAVTTALHRPGDGFEGVMEGHEQCETAGATGMYSRGNLHGGLGSRPEVIRAPVAVGTPVYDLPDRRRWATTTDTELDVFPPAVTDGWVRLAGPSSATGDRRGGWVARTAVSLP
ncbi:MAG: hypothetical protein ABI321_22000 [Polyangia bacterium]